MIPHSKPTLDESDFQAVSSVLASGQLVQGEQTSRFEAELAAWVNCTSAAAVSSGTAALHLALLALRVGPGDEVIIPTYVCTALLHAVRYVGAIPVLADIDLRDYNMAVDDARKRITPRTKALLLPHMFGQAADLEAFLSLGIPVIEDCAQALGSVYRDKPAGCFGVLSIFSFYATKVIATGEGGMIASRDNRLVERIRDLRDYDEKVDDRLRYNYKMTDFQAALGRSQLKRLPEFLKRRRAIADRYDQCLRTMNVPVPSKWPERPSIHFRYAFRHNSAESLIRTMNGHGIACRRPVYKPLHSYLGLSGYPAADLASEQSLSLPIYPSLSDDEVTRVVSVLKGSLQKGL